MAKHAMRNYDYASSNCNIILFLKGQTVYLLFQFKLYLSNIYSKWSQLLTSEKTKWISDSSDSNLMITLSRQNFIKKDDKNYIYMI